MGHRRIAIVGVAATLALLGLASPAQATGGGYGGHDRHTVTVKVRDDCDPASFNAVFGKDACVRQGHTTLEAFQAQFAATGRVKGWDFRPYVLHLRPGDRIKATNVGGEFHTFTKVARFGGGCLPLLNARPGGQKPLKPVKECGGVVFNPPTSIPKVFKYTGIEAGQTKHFTVGKGRAHVERYECLIHPWMRAVVYVDRSHSYDS